MKKSLFRLFSVIIVLGLMFSSCGQNANKLQGSETVFKSQQYHEKKNDVEVFNAVKPVEKHAEKPGTIIAGKNNENNTTANEEINIESKTKQENDLKAEIKTRKYNKLAPEIPFLNKSNKFLSRNLAAEGENNLLAILALVAGILAVLTGLFAGSGNFLFGVGAIVLGLIAKSDMKKKGVTDEKAKSMANWGIILGIAGLVIGLIVTILWIVIGFGFSFLPLFIALLGGY